MRATLADDVTVDYTCVNPMWGIKHYSADEFADLWMSEEHLGLKVLATQHFLGHPYFVSVTAGEIVVEWQQVAFHGRKAVGEDYSSLRAKITEQSDGHSFVRHVFRKTSQGWRIFSIRPEVVFSTGAASAPAVSKTRARKAE